MFKKVDLTKLRKDVEYIVQDPTSEKVHKTNMVNVLNTPLPDFH